ncbi:MAG: BREX system Lon protease-like protein BrxL [Desulfurococcaceae archaeon]
MSKHVELVGNVAIRDEKAVKKTTSGLLKLLFPNLEFSKSELRQIVQYAVELRQRVRDWLHKISPGEFSREMLSFKLR